MADRTFPGDPNPPPKAPEPTEAGGSSPSNTGSPAPTAPPPHTTSEGPDRTRPEEQIIYRAAPDADGVMSVYKMTADGEHRWGQVSVPDADKVLKQFGTFNETTGSYDVPEEVATKLVGGRVPLPAYLEAKWAGGEAAATRGLVGKLWLDGKLSDADALERGNAGLIRSQLKEAPVFVYQKDLVTSVSQIWENIKKEGVSGVGRRAAGSVAEMMPDLLNMGGDAAKAAAAFGAAGAGAGALAGPGGAAAGGLAGGAVGMSYGIFKHAFDSSAGNFALDMKEKGFDDATIKTAAPIAGALNAALMMGQVQYMTAGMRRTFLANVMDSPTVKGMLSRYVAETMAGASMSSAQTMVDAAVKNLAALNDGKPELFNNPSEVVVNAIGSGVAAVPGMAVMGVPGLGMEALTHRPNTAAETRAANEMTARIEERKAAGAETAALPSAPEAQGTAGTSASRSASGSQPGTPAGEFRTVSGKPLDESVTQHPGFVKAAEEAKPALEGIDPVKDPRGALRKYDEVAQGMHDYANKITPIFNDLTDEGKAAIEEKMKAWTERTLQLSQLAKYIYDPDKAIPRAAAEAAGVRPEELPPPGVDYHNAMREERARAAKAGPSPEEQVNELMTGYRKGEVPAEDLIMGAKKATEEAKAARDAKLERATRDVETESRIKAIQSDLADVRTLIDTLTRERDRYVRTGMPTRRLDQTLASHMAEEASLQHDLEFYQTHGATAAVTEKENLLMKPATLADIIKTGFTEGRKEVIENRARQIKDLVKAADLTAGEVKRLLKDKNIGLMGDVEFKNFIEGFDRARKDGVVEHVPGFKEAIAGAVERRGALAEVKKMQREKQIVHEQYVRQLHDLPPVKSMSTAQLRQYLDILRKYDEKDVALSPTRIAALHGTEMEGVKTTREARAKIPAITGRPIADLEGATDTISRLNKATPDAALRRAEPTIQPAIDFAHRKIEAGKALAEAAKSTFHELMAKAIDARHATMSAGERLVDFFAPQQNEMVRAIEEKDPAKRAELMGKLLPEEQKVVAWTVDWLASAREHLEKNDEMVSRFGQDYYPHARRDLLEVVREMPKTGLAEALRELLPSGDLLNSAVEKASSFMPFGFKKMMGEMKFRTGELEPSKNMAQVIPQYMEHFYRKVALDEIAPVLDTIAYSVRGQGDPTADLSVAGPLEQFYRQYINNKKGINNSTGDFGALLDPPLKAARAMASLHFIAAHYALEATKGVAVKTMEHMALGLGVEKAMVLKRTEQGKAILEKYAAFVGKGPVDLLKEPGRGLQDYAETALYGAFQGIHKTMMEDVLLGSMTKEEFAKGEVSEKRLAEIKLEAARWLDIHDTSSILGSSGIGQTFTQMKRWTIPPALSLIEDAHALGKSLTGKGELSDVQKRELIRLGTITVAGVTARAIVDKDYEDDSFAGHVVAYLRKDVISMWHTIDPEIFTAQPIALKYINSLAHDLSMLATLESYKKSDKLKGVEGLKRDLTPTMVKQMGFNPGNARKED